MLSGTCVGTVQPVFGDAEQNIFKIFRHFHIGGYAFVAGFSQLDLHKYGVK